MEKQKLSILLYGIIALSMPFMMLHASTLHTFTNNINNFYLDKKTGTCFVIEKKTDTTTSLYRMEKKGNNGKTIFEPVEINIGTNIAIDSFCFDPFYNPIISYNTNNIAVIKNINPTITPPLNQQNIDLYDGGNNKVNKSITSLAATHNYIFAAVKEKNKDKFPGETNWGADGKSGIALLRKNETNLFQINFDGSLDKTYAYKISDEKTSDVKKGSLYVAHTKQLADAGASASLYWDEHLQRLYVGYTIKAGAANNNLGCALVVGQLQDTIIEEPNNAMYHKLVCYLPFTINPESSPNWNLIPNAKEGVVTARPNEVIGAKPFVMHTSTGRDYLIVISLFGGTDVNNPNSAEICALPLQGKEIKQKEKIGLLAEIDTSDPTHSFKLLTSQAAWSKNDTNASWMLIGGGMQSNFSSQKKPTCLCIIGDTVYISLEGEDDELIIPTKLESGIFASTALFDEYGNIVAWTPWTRVYENKKINNFAIDPRTNCIWFTHKNNLKEIHHTEWNQDILQRTIIAKNFNDEMGVLGLFSFDSSSNCFYEAAIMVATGYDKVAIICNIWNKKYITTEYSSDENYYVVHKDIKLGPIFCAEVTRFQQDTDNQYLMVGGKYGMAVLAKDDGSGWTTQNDNFISDTSSFSKLLGANSARSFKKITFTKNGSAFLVNDIRKIIHDGKFTYIFTPKKILRCNIKIENVKKDSPTPVDITLLYEVSDDNELYDMALISAKENEGSLLVAHHKGLGILKTINKANASTFTLVEVIASNTPYSSIYKFDVMSSFRGGQLPQGNNKMGGHLLANIYATGLSADKKSLCVYRFYVANNEIKKIREPYSASNELPQSNGAPNTPYFYQMCSSDKELTSISLGNDFDHHIQQKNIGIADTSNYLFGGIRTTPDPDYFLHAWEPNSAITLGWSAIGGMQLSNTVRNPGTGALYLYGQFGLIANY